MDTKYAYMAGFVDADGSISISTVSSTKQYVPKLTVCNCNKTVVEMFEREFGGKVRERVWQKHVNWRPNFEWTLTARKGRNAVLKLLPYLRIKRDQALLVVKLQGLKDTFNGAMRRWDRELDAKCDLVYRKIKDRCKALNKRGK